MTTPARSRVLRFVILIGVVNLFADLTYEGGRSVTGPFLAQLGATAAVVSIVAGGAEFLGYTLRALAGYIADRTKRYWTLTFVGYAINMLAVPALALARSWPLAAGLITAERTGRAIRRPIVQGMLSHARDEVGGAWAFGINESLDALGATIGPLVMAFVIARGGDYRMGFGVLLASALLCLGALAVTQRRHPHPEMFEHVRHDDSSRFPRRYWLMLAGGAFVGFGFVDFALVAFHFQRAGAFDAKWIPIIYAVAMGAGAASNLGLGYVYDRIGLPTLIGVFLVGAWFAPLVFFGSSTLVFIGAALWGVNKGAQDTLFKPALASLVGPGRRSTAFGIFDMGFGIAWLAGSIAFGLLYDKSLTTLVTVSVVSQLLSLPLFALGMATATPNEGDRGVKHA